MIICDASVLFCLVDRTQPQHSAYKKAVMQSAQPLITTWPCLTEAMYLWLYIVEAGQCKSNLESFC